MLIALAGLAQAGGTPENALLIIDPSRPDSLYIGNYYKSIRNLPDANVLYTNPLASDFAAFADQNLDALFGTLTHANTADHIDYIICAAPESFYIDAPNLITDTCSPVRRFSISGAYTMAFIADEVLGHLQVTNVNRYYRGGPAAQYFDSSVSYLGGEIDSTSGARRYFIGAMLGYTGERGNTPAEIIAMIDRSVAADGAHPAGTFYFEETTDEARSGPRDTFFDTVVGNIQGLGGQAEHQMAVLPIGRPDCLGIMTGAADPGIEAADLTIVPGAFCDHLTSWAATFDISSQEKVSRWIVKGASGSWGEVEEPCNYPQKFPHPRVHVYYFRGQSLGESVFRSVQATPFQGLLYGDPLTRPFAYLPTVSVPDAPTGPVSGTIGLTPVAASPDPDDPPAIEALDLLVDGVLMQSIAPGLSFTLNTTQLSDGWHDLRVVAYDDTTVRSMGRWVGALIVNNQNRSATLNAPLVSGNLTTAFPFDVAATGATEVRLVQNGRVVAAAAGASASFSLFGATLGAGPFRVHAEAFFPDGRLVRSAPAAIDVAPTSDTPSGQPPTAFSFRKLVRNDAAFVVELPASYDGPLSDLSYELLSDPSQAGVPAGQSGPQRLMRPNSGASGTDSFTFRVNSPAGSSAVATVTLVYLPLVTNCPGDVNHDGQVGLSDLAVLLANFGATGQTFEDGDLDGDGDVDLADLATLLAVFGSTCP